MTGPAPPRQPARRKPTFRPAQPRRGSPTRWPGERFGRKSSSLWHRRGDGVREWQVKKSRAAMSSSNGQRTVGAGRRRGLFVGIAGALAALERWFETSNEKVQSANEDLSS